MSSIRSRNRVLIEFVKDTDTRSVGDRMSVDKASSVSLVHKKKVAKIVDDHDDHVHTAVEPQAPVGDDAA
jgi:hypothetical protein